eukprot:g72670.t1
MPCSQPEGCTPPLPRKGAKYFIQPKSRRSPTVNTAGVNTQLGCRSNVLMKNAVPDSKGHNKSERSMSKFQTSPTTVRHKSAPESKLIQQLSHGAPPMLPLTVLGPTVHAAKNS